MVYQVLKNKFRNNGGFRETEPGKKVSSRKSS